MFSIFNNAENTTAFLNITKNFLKNPKNMVRIFFESGNEILALKNTQTNI